ncbi:hypothetical protein [Blastococcus brunescens]|uniref:SpoIID/LytB domain-containing protein n=1 Tax=Blastococcus brunescens TaxID=1564165 RepID=A0ABZ1B211_9ACTN|nr:hypothetical protein [Blastococcus sp. BMG 8361]WRL64854.1 hypothetical protein U6N30_03675 [Blastococcus sp. BMG 8361]
MLTSAAGRTPAALVGILTLLLSGLAGVTGGVAQAAPSPDITLIGHGFGHGRGLSQWGAYGYATRSGWSHQEILGHYYGGTTPSDIGDPQISVVLTWLDGTAPTVTSGQTFVVDGRQLPAGSAARIGRNADGSWQLTTLSGCTGAVTGSSRITTPTVATAGPPATYGQLLTLCGPQARGYRGALTVVWDGVLHTVNVLAMDDYLRGVLPREMPASWGTQPGVRA